MLHKKAWSFACKDARLGVPKYLLWSLCLVQWFSAYQYQHHLELYKTCKFLTTPKIYYTRNSGGEPSNLGLRRHIQIIQIHLEVWEPLVSIHLGDF